ncbi:MAG TPA: flagellar export chaperone FliS [Bryobacteraceae bacterium]|nr:flagellar export chaperone FliS [Bryobacteraceae bacterium]
MPSANAYGGYLESQVLTADPLELVRLLYHAALESIRGARDDLAYGRIAQRSRRISKAYTILTQLSVSLDHARGGAVSRRLAELYDYMQRRLMEANLQQKAEPLIEVEGLLATLLEGWEKLEQPPESSSCGGFQRPPDDFPEYAGYGAVGCPAPQTECAAQAWSF